MPGSQPPLDPALVTEALHARILKELSRSQGVAPLGTDLLGGWVQVGRALERLLQVLFIAACDERGLDAAREFSRLSKEGWELDKAASGQLLRVLRTLFAERPPSGDRLRVLAALLQQRDSALDRVAQLRNMLLHAGREPTLDELRQALAALLPVVSALRASP
jgi:hypothetical protein